MKFDKIYFSCVLENNPVLVAQSYIWLTSLLHSVQVNAANIYVHIIGDFDKYYLGYLDDIGVNIIKTEPFDASNRYCNKLAQFNTFKSKADYDYVFLMDCDTAVISLEGLDLTDDVYAKIVDFPNPPLAILENIYKHKNLNYEYADTDFPIEGKNKTIANNANGGLYIISQAAFKDVTAKWEEYARWSLKNTDLYTETYKKHVDQVGFSMALNDLGLKMTELGIEWNFPTHIGQLVPDIAPNIIHFHDKIDQQMLLKKIGLEKVDKTIDEVNAMISGNLNKYLDNKLFWDLRYQMYPELGSGVGSRGDILEAKKKLLKYVSYGFYDKQIIDVGCGDLELTKDIPYKKYLGLDVSEKALEICKKKKPEWSFLHTSIEDEAVPEADLIICFDVLIHQSTREDFDRLLNNMIRKAGKRLIIGAYNSKPKYTSAITHYYEPVEDLIRKSNKFDEIAKVYEYRDVSVIVATVKKEHHDRDISTEKLNRAFNEVNRPDLLQYIADISRFHFGFFTSHYPRVFEYTWLLEKVLANGKIRSAIDIGAGVCPVPIALSEEGIKVFTVDGHPKIRDVKNKPNWNEWGFLDYSKLHPDIKSYHKNFEDFKAFKKVDLIYSISVIEHMPQNIRRKIIKKTSGLLKKGGLFLLTIDLVPDTDKIWNLNEGKIVEDEEIHGTVASLEAELKKSGFEIKESETQRSINDSRTDVLYVTAQKTHGLNLVSKFFK